MSVLSKNEKAKMNRKMTFFNYNLSLSQLHKNQSNLNKEEDFDTDTNKKNVPFVKAEELDEDEFNHTNLEEITEELYISA